MKELLKTFKPVIIPIILTIIFLFIQARLELKLPEYTAKIVNTGIQQNGIEKAVFKEVSSTTLNRVLLFTDEDEYILKNYEKVEVNEENLKKYKLLNEEDIYVLKDNTNLNKLEGYMQEITFFLAYITFSSYLCIRK